MKVECEVNYEEIENEDGRMVDGVTATCSRCGHCEQAYGTSSSSVKRCLVMLRENCPEEEKNFYVSDVED